VEYNFVALPSELIVLILLALPSELIVLILLALPSELILLTFINCKSLEKNIAALKSDHHLFPNNYPSVIVILFNEN
jgi:hypothetical protein